MDPFRHFEQIRRSFFGDEDPFNHPFFTTHTTPISRRRIRVHEGPLEYEPMLRRARISDPITSFHTEPLIEEIGNEEEMQFQEALKQSLLEEEERKRNAIQEIKDEEIIDLSHDDEILPDVAEDTEIEEEPTYGQNKRHFDLRPPTIPKVELVEDEDETDEELQKVIKASLEESQRKEAPIIIEDENEEEIHRNRSIRREQDVAFEESLRIDQEKQRRMEEEIQQQKLAEQQREEQEAIQLSLELQKLSKCQQLAAKLPPEPRMDDPQAAHIIVRLPSGDKLERRFYSYDTLQSLKDFVESKEYDVNLPSGNWQLVIPYPRKPLSDLSLTFKDSGLFPRAAIALEIM